jgi:hypothetical protein
MGSKLRNKIQINRLLFQTDIKRQGEHSSCRFFQGISLPIVSFVLDDMPDVIYIGEI